jgi:hypothetical protein
VIPYEALSYYWGLEEPTVPITIVTYNSSAPRMSMANIVQKKFWIRPNLHAALIQLRSSDPANEVALWVDAICINQQDKVEKTAQVSRMHEIYSAASNVCIWLGLGEIDRETGSIDPDETEETFDFIRQMLSLRRLDQLVQSMACFRPTYEKPMVQQALGCARTCSREGSNSPLWGRSHTMERFCRRRGTICDEAKSDQLTSEEALYQGPGPYR